MRIGIVIFTEGFSGTSQYSLTMLRSIVQLKKEGLKDEFVIFTDNIHHPFLQKLDKLGWTIDSILPMSKSKKIIKNILVKVLNVDRLGKIISQTKNNSENPAIIRDLDKKVFRKEIDQWFRSHKIELMIYPTSHPLAFETSIPYILSIHDLQHRIQPEFPEVSQNGEWESREYLYRNGIKNATLIIAESEIGKQDIIKFYDKYIKNKESIKILPYLPSFLPQIPTLVTEKKNLKLSYTLPENYLFYPAQFWPHKNHLRIIQALGLIKRKLKLNIPIVFCGSSAGDLKEKTFLELTSESKKLTIDKNIHFLGYVNDELLPFLYKKATALIMPTFFGPTNLPILEAWSFNCPVITSDIKGVRDQAGNAALLVDPRSVKAIAKAIIKIWKEDKLRLNLIKLGRQRLALYSEAEYNNRLREILEDAKVRLKR